MTLPADISTTATTGILDAVATVVENLPRADNGQQPHPAYQGAVDALNRHAATLTAAIENLSLAVPNGYPGPIL